MIGVHKIQINKNTIDSLKWENWTAQNKKAKLYNSDFIFHESWDDLYSTLGDDINNFKRIAAITFKPESIKRRCLKKTLNYAKKNN